MIREALAQLPDQAVQLAVTGVAAAGGSLAGRLRRNHRKARTARTPRRVLVVVVVLDPGEDPRCHPKSRPSRTR